MAADRRFISRGCPAPPLPADFSARLGRLEDLSGVPLEEFARRWWLSGKRAKEWRCGAVPTPYELRAMMEWACSVPGGVAVLLTDCSHSWPYRGPGDWR